MRLGFFYRDYLGPGAYPRDTKHLAEAVAVHVEHVYVYCYCKSREEEGSSTVGNLTTRRFFVPERWWTYNFTYVPTALRTAVASEDGLHALTLIGAFVPENYAIARLARRSDLPYLVSPGEPLNAFSLSARGVKGVRKHLWVRWFERAIVEQATAVQVCSPAHHLQLLSLGFRLDAARTFVGREGIDWDAIGEDVPDVGALPPFADGDEPVFGFLGRLLPHHKGLDLLLHAWRYYKELGGPGRLQLAGPGATRDVRYLRRLADRLELADIEFLPPKYGRDKYVYLRSLSALVHPSRHDGITRVVREGLATGSILVTTYHTHVYELLLDEGAGIVAATDAFDLAIRMRAFADRTPAERERMRAAAARVAARLSWDASGAQFLGGVRAALGLAEGPGETGSPRGAPS